MPRKLNNSYRRQRRKDGPDLAFVELGSRRHYLGKYDTQESRERYHALLAEWEANGKQLLPDAETDNPTVSEVLAAFWQHAKGHYVLADGSPTSEVHLIRQAFRPLRRLYGSVNAADFGPRRLRAVRQSMIDQGLARSTINGHIGRIRRCFKWAVEHEMVPPATHQGIACVQGLQKGRTDAREPNPVRPVPLSHVTAIEPYVSRQVWAIVQLQLLTGARPGELLQMRPADIDMAGDVWIYCPSDHKTSHHGHKRTIYLGPKAQQMIRPFLNTGRSVRDFLFSPIEAGRERRERMHLLRKTPMSCGNRPGECYVDAPKRTPGKCYTVCSYRQAIQRACDRAFPLPMHLKRRKIEGAKGSRWETPAEWRQRLGENLWREQVGWRQQHRWHPHQLRHNAATSLRREFGVDVAQTILGHRLGSAITEVYAEANQAKARHVIGQVG